MIFDTHTHYDDEAFSQDREAVLGALKKHGVGAVVNMGASMRGVCDSVELAEKYPFFYAAVGIHPDHVGELTQEGLERLKQLSRKEKVVAIGEIGLDYHWDVYDHETQKQGFMQQLDLAIEEGLPVVIHSREAAADTLDIVKQYHERVGERLFGVIHCFSYSKEQAMEYVDMGFFIGVGGVVTFKNGRKLKEVLEAVPLSALVVETDCPYLAPEPYRGKRNSSEKLSYVIEEIAKIKGVTVQEAEEITWNNAHRLYPRISPV